ncbi:MAG: alpha/beta hydrolase [Candidatus Ornithospirochaeta sp.]
MKRIIKRTIIVVAAVLLAVVLAFFIYSSFYYKANDTALEASTYGTVRGNLLVFSPEENSGDGLIFYPGGKVEYSSYAPLMKRLSDNGVTAVLVKMPFNLAVFDSDAADGIRQMFPEVENWYIGGHSLGGSMAASYVKDHTEDFRGLVLLASYSTADLCESGLKVISILGTKDGVLNTEKYSKNRKNLPKDAEEYIIQGANHAQFGSYGPQSGDKSTDVDEKEQQDDTASLILDWIAYNR